MSNPFLFLDAKNSHPLAELWAVVSVDEEGNEGLCAAPVGPTGMVMPLVTAHKKNLPVLSTWAETFQELTDKKIRLVRFIRESPSDG